MEEAVNKKADESKKKKRTSLKSILGGDILATDFFRRQTKLLDRKSTRLNSSHSGQSRMPSSA